MGASPYAAGKVALNSLAKTSAIELAARKIRVNVAITIRCGTQMFQCRPAPSLCLMRSLIRSLADSGKRAGEMFSAYSKMERLAFRMNASCTAKRVHRSQIAR
jgi:NAD(P)-dependent dehydrogenase (short-subunit alcohol dehydrogenase family)